MKFSFGTSTLDPSANTTRTLNQIENDTSNSQIHGGSDDTVLIKVSVLWLVEQMMNWSPNKRPIIPVNVGAKESFRVQSVVLFTDFCSAYWLWMPSRISLPWRPGLAKIPKVSIPVSILAGIESESVSIKSIDTQSILCTRLEMVPR